MQITSPVFNDGEEIPLKYSCEGLNVSPPLHFSGIPSNAKSLVLLVEDPDASAKPWVHWVVYNIPVSSTGFEENSFPQGASQGMGNGDSHKYEGPCPPAGTHNYEFKLFAIDIFFPVQENIDRRTILKDMEGH